ncbi:hypothetical protein F511_21755, partial [Dorcoceras hygrometricum]
IQDIKDKMDPKVLLFDQWNKFHTGIRLNKITSMTLVKQMAKIEDSLFPWAETKKLRRLDRTSSGFRLRPDQLRSNKLGDHKLRMSISSYQENSGYDKILRTLDWYCSLEPYFLRLSSIYAAVWSKIGGAELVFLRPFDWYQFGELNRRIEGARSSFRVRISS